MTSPIESSGTAGALRVRRPHPAAMTTPTCTGRRASRSSRGQTTMIEAGVATVTDVPFVVAAPIAAGLVTFPRALLLALHDWAHRQRATGANAAQVAVATSVVRAGSLGQRPRRRGQLGSGQPRCGPPACCSRLLTPVRHRARVRRLEPCWLFSSAVNVVAACSRRCSAGVPARHPGCSCASCACTAPSRRRCRSATAQDGVPRRLDPARRADAPGGPGPGVHPRTAARAGTRDLARCASTTAGAAVHERRRRWRAGSCCGARRQPP